MGSVGTCGARGPLLKRLFSPSHIFPIRCCPVEIYALSPPAGMFFSAQRSCVDSVHFIG